MKREIIYDIDTQSLTDSIKEILNKYPGLGGKKIKFCMLPTETGMAFFPISGAVVISEKKDVTGHVEQNCIYPLLLTYRAGGLSETNKIRVKEMLDTIGKWLEGKTVDIEGEKHTLSEYPRVEGDKSISYIRRTSPAYLYSQTEANVEDWVIELRVEYTNLFEKIQK